MGLVTFKSVSTDYLAIKQFAYSSYGLMTYLIADVEEPLFIGGISVQRIAGEGIIVGSIIIGTKARPGRVNLQVSREIYDALLAVSTSAGSHKVQITYDELTYAPLAIAVV